MSQNHSDLKNLFSQFGIRFHCSKPPVGFIIFADMCPSFTSIYLQCALSSGLGVKALVGK